MIIKFNIFTAFRNVVGERAQQDGIVLINEVLYGRRIQLQ